jgi:hypothetical protein
MAIDRVTPILRIVLQYVMAEVLLVILPLFSEIVRTAMFLVMTILALTKTLKPVQRFVTMVVFASVDSI